jgi:hypothetical protein
MRNSERGNDVASSSLTDGSMVVQSREALRDLRAQPRFVELFADEHQLAAPLLAFLPEPIPHDREPVVHPVKNGAPGITDDLQKAFAAKDPLLFLELLHK